MNLTPHSPPDFAAQRMAAMAQMLAECRALPCLTNDADKTRDAAIEAILVTVPELCRLALARPWWLDQRKDRTAP